MCSLADLLITQDTISSQVSPDTPLVSVVLEENPL